MRTTRVRSDLRHGASPGRSFGPAIMLITIDYALLATANLVISTILFTIAAIMLLASSMCAARPSGMRLLVVLVVNGFAGAITLWFLGPSLQVFIAFLPGLFLTIAATCL